MLPLRSLQSVTRLFTGSLSPRSRSGRSWSDALSLVQTGAFAAVSLDCFDTLLARGIPDREQLVLAETAGLGTGYSASQALRSLSVGRERAKRLAAGDQEPTAASIWTEYCAAIGIPQSAATQLCAHELKLLEMTSFASPEALNFVTAVESFHLPWIVCSDTRWSATFLSGLLRGKGFAIGPESIFCSCDHGKSKFRGGLYPIAYQCMIETIGRNVPPSSILHIGDNFFADNCSAAAFGMLTVNIPSALRQPAPAADADVVKAYLETVRRDIALGIR
jgi:hypothetical protein